MCSGWHDLHVAIMSYGLNFMGLIPSIPLSHPPTPLIPPIHPHPSHPSIHPIPSHHILSFHPPFQPSATHPPPIHHPSTTHPPSTTHFHHSSTTHPKTTRATSTSNLLINHRLILGMQSASCTHLARAHGMGRDGWMDAQMDGIDGWTAWMDGADG